MQVKIKNDKLSRAQHRRTYQMESQAVARLVVAIKANLDHEVQHGPVKVYSAEERAAFAASRGL